MTSSQLTRVTFASWVDALWGYDVFIAHRRADAGTYATALYEQLQAEKITAFIDRVIYGAGDSLLVATRRHAAKSTLLLLVGSPELLILRRPVDWIEREIEAYLSAHAADPKIILVDIGRTVSSAAASLNQDAISNHPILEQLVHYVRIEQDAAALSMRPSEAVLAAVRRNLIGRRRDRSRLLFFQGVAAVLALALVVAGALGWIARRQRNAAIAETARARAHEYSAKATAMLDGNPRGAVLAALEAMRQTTTGVPEAVSQEVFSTAFGNIRGVPLSGYGQFLDGSNWVQSIALSADGGHVAVGHFDGSIFLWNVTDRSRPVRTRIVPPLLVSAKSADSPPIEAVAVSRAGHLTVVMRSAGDGEISIQVEDESPRRGIEDASPDALRSAMAAQFAADPASGRFLLLTRDRSTLEMLDPDASSGAWPLKPIYRSKARIEAMTMSADGKLIASIDASGTVNVLRSGDGTVVRSIPIDALSSLPSAWDDSAAFRKAFGVTGIRISPDGTYVALLARLPSERSQPQQMAEIWDVSATSPKVVASYPRARNEFGRFDEGNGNLVTDIGFSPGSTHMLLAHNNEVRLWSLRRVPLWAPPETTITLAGEYSAMAFSPDSSRAAVGDSNGSVWALDWTSSPGTPIKLLDSRDGAGEIRKLTFSTTSNLVLAGGGNDAAWLLATDGSPVDTQFAELLPPDLASGETVVVAAEGSTTGALTRGGIWLASLATMSTRRLSLPEDLAGKASAHLLFNRNGTRAVVWSETLPSLYALDLSSGIDAATVSRIDYPAPALSQLTYDDLGEWAIMSDGEHRALLLRLTGSGRGERVLDVPGYAGDQFLFSARSEWLLSGPGQHSSKNQGRAQLFRIKPEGLVTYELPGAPTDNLDDFVFAPGGDLLACSEVYKRVLGENKVFAWRLDTSAGPQSPVVLSGHTMTSRIAFSPNGRWMLSADALPGAMDSGSAEYLPKKLQLWRVPQWTAPRWQRSFKVQSIEASFSPDSAWLTVGTDGDLNAVLIDLTSSSLNETVPINSGGTLVGDWKFSFSPDGRWFTTQGYNAAVRLWRLDDRNAASLVEEDVAHDGARVTFSPDSSTLAVSDDLTTRVLWLSQMESPLRRISLPMGGSPRYVGGPSRLILHGDKAVKSFELDPAKAMRSVSVRTGRNLTWAEWNRLFPAREYSKTLSDVAVDPSIVADYLERAETAVKVNRRDQARVDYELATRWALDSGNPVAANAVAWSGAIHGFPGVVLPAADLAVHVDPTNGNFVDTRGVTRCGLGDFQGALLDFEVFIAWGVNIGVSEATLQGRREWAASLKAGKLPPEACGTRQMTEPKREEREAKSYAARR